MFFSGGSRFAFNAIILSLYSPFNFLDIRIVSYTHIDSFSALANNVSYFRKKSHSLKSPALFLVGSLRFHKVFKSLTLQFLLPSKFHHRDEPLCL